MRFALDDMGIMQHEAPNRFGKTFMHALGGWYAYHNGRKVYANCPTDPKSGQIEHILNYPHIDYDPYKLRFTNLFDAYVMIDEAGQVMDARVCSKKDVRQLGYFIYQAKKRGLSLHYDTLRHKNIDPRIRLIPDFILLLERVPKNWRLPLQSIRIQIEHSEGISHAIIRNPTIYFGNPAKGIPPIYNDKVMLRSLENA